MKKKIFSVMLSLVLAASLAACGGGGASQPAESTAAAEEQNVTLVYAEVNPSAFFENIKGQ